MASPSRMHRRRIGELLVAEGLISGEQLDQGLEIQQETRDLLGTILMDLGHISETDITKVLCMQYQLPFLSLVNYEYDPKLVEVFPRGFLHQHKILPFDQLGKTLLLLVGEVPDAEVLEEVPKRTNLNAALYVGYLSEVTRALNELIPIEKKDPGAAASTATATATAKVTAGAAADAPAASKAGGHRIEIVPGIKDEESSSVSNPLIFGDNQESFLEELDTTWDSIFQEEEGAGPLTVTPEPETE